MNNGSDRRDFLVRSAAASASLATVAGGLPQPLSAAESAPRKLVIGVMGLSRGQSLAETFAAQENVEIGYVCDVDRQRMESTIRKLKDRLDVTPVGVTDFRRILDAPQVDALVCAAPNHWHGPATLLACAAGKHVYVEKPCAHNPHEGELMVQSAGKHQRCVQVGTQRRSSPGWIEAIQRLQQGAIGRPYLARAWYGNLRGSIGRSQPQQPPEHLNYDLWQGPAPPVPYRANVVHYNWHWQWHWGNGELGNNGVHTLDLCRWGLSVDYPQRVTSSGGRYGFDDDQQTPDTHSVCFDFSDERSITWQGLSCNKHDQGFVAFYGTDGTMEVDSNGGFRIYSRADKLIEEVPGQSGGQAEHVANFCQAIRAERPDHLNCGIDIAYPSTLLCHLGNIAYRVGRSLQCETDRGQIVADNEAMSYWRRTYAEGWEPSV